MQNVLVIGAAADAKPSFLSTLIDNGAQVVVVDPSSCVDISYPSLVEVHHLKDLGRATLLPWLQDLRTQRQFDRIGSAYEQTQEACAFARELLGAPGLGPEEVALSRNKARMYDFLRGAGVRTAPFAVITGPDIPTRLRAPFVLKPALATGNLGVRYVPDQHGLVDAWAAAHAELSSFAERDYQFEPYACGPWILCEYIEGKEVEVHALVENGRASTLLIQEKLIIQRRGTRIEENAAIAPPFTLSSNERASLTATMRSLIRVVSDKLAAPRAVGRFLLYAEFRIDADGRCHCLEFTFRPGGGPIAHALRLHSGIDLNAETARAVLDLPFSPARRRRRAVYWQVLYSDRCGTFEGISSPTGRDVEVHRLVPLKTEIQTPHSEYLGYVLARGDTPSATVERAAQTLRATRVQIATPEGQLSICQPVPGGQT